MTASASPATPASPMPPAPLSIERFREVVDLVACRDRSPAAAQAFGQALAEDPALAAAWTHLLDTGRAVIQDMNREAAYQTSRTYDKARLERTCLVRPSRYNYGRKTLVATPSTPSPRAAEFALLFGELRRVAALTGLGRDEVLVADLRLDEPLRKLLAAEGQGYLEALAPLSTVASDLADAAALPDATVDSALPLDLLQGAVRDLQAINALIKPTHKLVRASLRRGKQAAVARRLASKHFFPIEWLPDAFQSGYDARWHSNAKTSEPTGAYIDGLRARAEEEAPPAFLAVLAASSDGDNRAVAGVATRTPAPVYEQMIYDNSLRVLYAVVQNEQFDQKKAYAMLKTDLPHQIVAVMLPIVTANVRIALEIRLAAARRALQHPRVDLVKVYQFLQYNGQGLREYDQRHAAGEDAKPIVPELWHQLLLGFQRRLYGAERELETLTPETPAYVQMTRVVQAHRDRVEQFAKYFMAQVLEPYREHVKTLTRLGQRTYSYVSHRDRVAKNEATSFVEQNAFVLNDLELVNVLFEGVKHSDKDLLALLECLRDAGVRLDAPSLLAAALKHEKDAIRLAAFQLFPNISPEDVATIVPEVKARIAKDLAAIDTEVLTYVIPDFEEIEGTARKQSANHHEFLALKVLSEGEIVEFVVREAKKDWRLVPDKLRAYVAERRAQSMRDAANERLLAAIPDEAPVERSEWAERFHDGAVEQGDMFGGLGAPATPPTPRRPRRPAGR